MSVGATIWAWKQHDLSAGEKLVLLNLADRHNEVRGFAWPSYEDIALRTSLSVRSVQRHVASLDADGYITRRPRLGAYGRKLGYQFYLDIGRGTPLSFTEGADFRSFD